MGSKANWSPVLPPSSTHITQTPGVHLWDPPHPCPAAGIATLSSPPPSPARTLSHGWLCQGDVGVPSPTAESQAWAGAGSRAGWGSCLPPHPGIPSHPPPSPRRPGKPGRDGVLDLIHGCNNLAGLSLQVNQPLGAGWVLSTGQGAASPSWAPRGGSGGGYGLGSPLLAPVARWEPGDRQSDSRSVLSPCLSFPVRPWEPGVRLRAWQLGRDGFYQIFGYLFARPGQLSPVGI